MDFTDEFQELRLPATGIELAACHWHADAAEPFFMLHGWLDNAASMAPLAQRLPQLQILAPDMAGHGRSDFRSADANYDLTTEILDIYQLANHLGWEKFGLIGHSRGAIVAALFAGAFAERVHRLVLIDGGSSIGFNLEDRPARVARSMREQVILARKSGSLFPSRHAALKARTQGYVPVSPEIAELLASRSLIEENQGFRWRADQRLKAVSANPLDVESAKAFFSAIRCPVLQIIGDRGLVVERGGFGGPVECIADFERLTLPGNHHLHITEAEAVADAVADWLQRHAST